MGLNTNYRRRIINNFEFRVSKYSSNLLNAFLSLLRIESFNRCKIPPMFTTTTETNQKMVNLIYRSLCQHIFFRQKSVLITNLLIKHSNSLLSWFNFETKIKLLYYYFSRRLFVMLISSNSIRFTYFINEIHIWFNFPLFLIMKSECTLWRAYNLKFKYFFTFAFSHLKQYTFRCWFSDIWRVHNSNNWLCKYNKSILFRLNTNI